MTIKKDTLQNIFITICVIIFVIFIFFLFTNKTSSNSNIGSSPVSYSGDTQVLDLTAKSGFTPNVITAQANRKTILNVITNKTFDCSASVRIPSLNISQNLPLTGTTQIDIGAHNAGDVVDGTCLMGMYSFKIKFI